MTTPIWRVEFHRAAVRDLHKLGTDAEKRILRYLRERIAGSKDPLRPCADRRPQGTLARVGDYRIVAAIEEERFVVLVVTVGDRREVYR
jgi:mRNA interferase RelE/StbE